MKKKRTAGGDSGAQVIYIYIFIIELQQQQLMEIRTHAVEVVLNF